MRIVLHIKKIKEKIVDRLLMLLITKKAYKGYIIYNTQHEKNNDYHSYKDFKKIEFYKILFCFRIYLHKNNKINSPLFMSKNNLLKHYFKSLI